MAFGIVLVILEIGLIVLAIQGQADARLARRLAQRKLALEGRVAELEQQVKARTSGVGEQVLDIHQRVRIPDNSTHRRN